MTDPTGYNWLTKTWKKAWKSPIFRAVLGIVVAVIAPAFLVQFGGALFGATVGGVTTLSFAGTVVVGGLSGFAATGTLKGALTGAFTAGLMYGVGTLGNELGLQSGGIGKIALHAGAGCISSVAGGGSCKTGAMSGALGEFGHNIGTGSSIELGTIKSAMLGGIGSKISGGKFADGAATGAFGYLFNCVAHKCNGADYGKDKYHFHEYQTEQKLCNTAQAGCMDASRQQLACNSAPGQSVCDAPGKTVTNDLILGSQASPNTVTQYMPNPDMIINGTSPGHILQDGYVVRWLSVNKAGDVTVYTYGRGNNTSSVNQVLNSVGGPLLFHSIGLSNRIEVRNATSK
jgi:hypothetical protein